MDKTIELMQQRLGYDATNLRSSLMVALYASAVDLCHSIDLLSRQSLLTPIPILLRSLLEVCVEVKLLAADADYAKHMQAAYFQIQFKKIGKADENPYFAELRASPDYEAKKKEWTDKWLQHEQHYRRLTIREKFIRAGMLDEYDVVYSMLSDHAHSSASGLFARHIKSVDGRLQVIVLRDAHIEELDTYVYSAAQLLLEIGVIVHQHLNTGAEGALQGLQERLRDETS